VLDIESPGPIGTVRLPLGVNVVDHEPVEFLNLHIPYIRTALAGLQLLFSMSAIIFQRGEKRNGKDGGLGVI
jgi:hypothetical protein